MTISTLLLKDHSFSISDGEKNEQTKSASC